MREFSTATVPVARATVSEPQSTEQAWALFKVMFAEVVAEAEGIISEWDPTNKPRENAAKNNLFRQTQDYVQTQGDLNIPLRTLGASFEAREQAKRLVLSKLHKSE